ncbi:MAG: nitrite/sulfite reductase, partial [Acidimicrobiales bacterium]
EGARPAGGLATAADRDRGAGDADIIRMHFSGCSASCAQPQIADIGFRGDTATGQGRIQEAVDIGLGGSLGADVAFIDWIEGAKPVDEVPEALERLVDAYDIEHRPGELFHQWARRRPNAELRAVLTPGASDEPVVTGTR